MNEIISLNMEMKEEFYLVEQEHFQSKESKLFKWNKQTIQFEDFLNHVYSKQK